MFDWLFPDRTLTLEREIRKMSERVAMLGIALGEMAVSVDRVLAELVAAKGVPVELEAAVASAVEQVNVLKAKLDAAVAAPGPPEVPVEPAPEAPPV